MSKLQYALVGGEDPEERGLGQNNTNIDEPGHRDGVSDLRDVCGATKSKVMHEGGRTSHSPEGLTTQEYRRMEFNSDLTDSPDSKPFWQRISLFFKQNLVLEARSSKEYCIRYIAIAFILVLLVLCAILSLIVFSSSESILPIHRANLSSHCPATSYWKGWQSINFAFPL
jgi:hypothetical protein